MKIKDFNKLVFDEVIPANNASGSFADRTELTVTTEDVYLLNPVTSLATEMSQFYYTYWNSYNDALWIDSSYPDEVVYHMQNHYRAVALSMLQKQGLTVSTFKSILNIALGYPFTLVSGIVSIDNSDPTDYYISQYPLMDEAKGETHFIYKISKSETLLIQDGDILDFYSPIVSGIEYYDYFSSGDSWFSGYDPFSVVPLDETKELDFLVNKRRVVGISRKLSSNYSYDFTFLGKLLSRIVPKDVILLYKEIS